jgi:hypothetical protein
MILVGVAGGLIFLALVCVAVGITMITRGPGGTPAVPTTSGTVSTPSLSGTGSVPLTQTAPSAIEIKGRKFDVTPVVVDKGTWPYQRDSLKGDKAAWVYGTLINYVIGLDASDNNKELLRQLTEADPIKMTTSSGRVVMFRYSGRQWVSVDKTDVFRQIRPGLTLVLLGDKDEQRLVVSASYMAENEPTPIASALATVGTPVEVAGARVKVLNGRLIKTAAGLPAGNAYYQVDFTVTATSGPLDASLFQMELQDASGKRYMLSPPASAGGPYGPPGGQLLANLTLTVIWTFSPQAGAASPARFQLSTAGSASPIDPRTLVVVQVTQARYSVDGQSLSVSGGIGNTSKEAVTVSLADINLQAGSSLIQVNSTDPPLPWTLQPGQNLAFVVHFARPPAGTAIFRLLQSSFELSGLQ